MQALAASSRSFKSGKTLLPFLSSKLAFSSVAEIMPPFPPVSLASSSSLNSGKTLLPVLSGKWMFSGVRSSRILSSFSLLPEEFHLVAKSQNAGTNSDLGHLGEMLGVKSESGLCEGMLVGAVAAAIGVYYAISSDLPPEGPDDDDKKNDPKKNKKKVLTAKEKERFVQLLNELKKHLSKLKDGKATADLTSDLAKKMEVLELVTNDVAETIALIERVTSDVECEDQLALLMKLCANMEKLIANTTTDRHPFALGVMKLLGFDLVGWLHKLYSILTDGIGFMTTKLVMGIGVAACVSCKVNPGQAVSILQMVFEDTIEEKRRKIRKLQARNAGNPMHETSLDDIVSGQQRLMDLITTVIKPDGGKA